MSSYHMSGTIHFGVKALEKLIRIEMAPSKFYKCFSFTLGTKYAPPTHTH